MHRFQHALGTVKLAAFVHRLGHAVGDRTEPAAGLEHELARRIDEVADHAYGGPPECISRCGALPGWQATGGSCPALQKARWPVRASSTPASAVTKSDSGLSRLISAFAWLKISAGSRAPRRAMLLSRDFDSAMKRLAARPLPETSPTRKKRWCGSSMKQS